MKNNNQRDMGISLCRIIATTMIVICHLGTAYGYSSIGQFFQSGVQVFLFISGLLYGDKEIQHVGAWLFKRWKRISIPCYIHSLIIILICLISNVRFSVLGFIEVLLNVEGYHHVVTMIPNPWLLPGTAHFWFVTAIMLCYLIVVFLKLSQSDHLLHSHKIGILVGLFCLSVVTGCFGIRIDYLFIFMLGYVLSNQRENSITKQRLIVSSLMFVCAVILRLLGKIYCDQFGDNNLYLYVIIPVSYNAIAFSVFNFIKKIGEIVFSSNNTPDFTKKVILLADELTFYVFITHYMFVDGPTSLVRITPFESINIIFIIFGTILTSMILKRMSDSIIHFHQI